MSGGVDSSVAALLLKQAGYEVVGVTMRITPDGMVSTFRKLACYGEDEAAEIQDVERVARHLGIEYRVVDLRQEYEERILNYFRQEYARGRTPNPCVKCNAEIKFGLLLEGCRKLGLEYDYFATGHYARVTYGARSGRWLLLKARDETKDQSYFLALLSQEQLSRSLFPLGELRKSEVRRIAREHQLPVSDKEESQDFYAGDYRELLPKGKPGPIKDLSGRVFGEHKGIENYTVGQRRGLGIASGGRLYVVKIDAASNTVYVGEEKDLLTSVFFVDGLNWVARVPAAGEEIEATVKVRYKSPELACRIIPESAGDQIEGKAEETKGKSSGQGSESPGEAKISQRGEIPQSARVVLLTPYRAVTPGQVAVFYDGEAVLGAGFIRNGSPA